MDIENLAEISLEGCLSLLLLTACYKLYRAKIDTESDGSCCRLFNFKMTTHNQGSSHEQMENV